MNPFVRKLIILCLGAPGHFTCLAQEVSTIYYSSLSGSASECSIQTFGGDFILTGHVKEQMQGQFNLDGVVLCIDSLSNIKWANQYGGAKDDYFQKSIITADSNIVVVGNTRSYGPFYSPIPFDTLRQNIIIFKMDTLGNILWSRIIGDSLQNYAYDVVERQNKELLVLGTVNQSSIFPANDQDILLFSLSEDGLFNWSKVIYSVNGYSDIPSKIINCTDNGVLISGQTENDNSNSSSDVFVVKLDSLMNHKWSNTTNDSLSFGPTFLLSLNNSESILSFSTRGHGSPVQFSDFVVSKIDSNGNFVWNVKYGNLLGGDDKISALSNTTNSSGLLYASNSRIGKMDYYGNPIWSRNSTANFTNSIKNILEKFDGGILYSGINLSSSPFSLSKVEVVSTGLNCEGLSFAYPFVNINIQPVNWIIGDSVNVLSVDSGFPMISLPVSKTSICESMTGLNDFSNHEDAMQIVVYPNPFKDIINFKYIYNEVGVRLELYDSMGRLIFESFEMPASINLGEFKNGLYHIRAITQLDYSVLTIVKNQ